MSELTQRQIEQLKLKVRELDEAIKKLNAENYKLQLKVEELTNTSSKFPFNPNDGLCT